MVGAGIYAALFLGNTVASEQLPKWNFPAFDIHGRTITAETFLDRVTVVSFSTHKSQTKDMQLGQEIGERFGLNRRYQSIAIPNTSDVPIWARFLATMKVARAEKLAIREAVQRQQANGNMKITEKEIRKKMIFINDKDGKIWDRLGLSANPTNSFLGIIDKTGTMIFLQAAPINMDKVFRVLEMQLNVDRTRWSNSSILQPESVSSKSRNIYSPASDHQ